MLTQQFTLFDVPILPPAQVRPDPAVTLYLSIIVEPGGLCHLTLDADAPLRPSDDSCT